jgi:single-stranded-DNA-specific exonuclease
LLDVAGRKAATVVASDLGFAVGPRINAAGRMEDMSIGIECLLTDDESHASALADTLDAINKERRTVEAGMKRQAVELADRLSLGTDPPPVAYCLYDDSWHQGVVGLVASRIREKTGRPVLALAPGEDEEWKGSARSVEGLHIRDVLARIDALRPGLISKFGGHAMAAGLSIEFSRVSELEEAFLQVVEEMTRDRDWTDPILSDGQLDAGEVNLEMAEVLRDAGPWGQGFPEPLFDGIFEVVDFRIVGENHLKLQLRQDGDEKVHDAIMFRYLENGREIPSKRVHVAYRLDVNEFRGRISHQLMLEYLEEIA